MKGIAFALCLLAGLAPTDVIAQKPPAKPAAPPAPTFYTTKLPPAEMTGKQAVLATTMGEIVIDLLPDGAPNHVGHFIDMAREGTYDGTTFHRAVKMGIVQGGDPLSKDPSKRDQYGTGGLNKLRAEPGPERHVRGAVSAVLANSPDSGGTQFFISVVDQPALDGKYTVFGRVSEGIRIVEKISSAPVDGEGRVVDRIEIQKVTIRDKPAPAPEPFVTESAEELQRYQVVLETSLGEITIGFLPGKAPNHMRNFLRLASSGVYDGMSFHRVAKGFVIQSGHLPTRSEPLTEQQERWVPTSMAPEFNDTVHVKGVVSMARLDDPASATTSFFIVTAPSPMLNGKYTAFGQVVSGLDVVDAIEAVPVNGEAPVTRVDLKRVRVEKRN